MRVINLTARSLLLGIVSAFALAAQTTGTSTLSLNIPAEASITITTPTTNLTAASAFAPYTGTTGFSFSIRTSASGGTGSIQLKITSDFTPSGGPSVGTPPTAGDLLTYGCNASTGTACSGSQTASSTVSTPVVVFGADAHSPTAGASGTVSWSLTNDTIYKSGSYNATATFTISAT